MHPPSAPITVISPHPHGRVRSRIQSDPFILLRFLRLLHREHYSISPSMGFAIPCKPRFSLRSVSVLSPAFFGTPTLATGVVFSINKIKVGSKKSEHIESYSLHNKMTELKPLHLNALVPAGTGLKLHVAIRVPCSNWINTVSCFSYTTALPYCLLCGREQLFQPPCFGAQEWLFNCDNVSKIPLLGELGSFFPSLFSSFAASCSLD